MTALDRREDMCQKLCFLSYKCSNLGSKISDAGAELLQTWPATNEGVRAFTAGIPEDDIFVLVFRGTQGVDEWLQYLSILSKRYKPLENGEPSHVYALWIDILNEMWNCQGTPEREDGLGMKDVLWNHLEDGKKVWITGHSKGGALATTAAARLVLGTDGRNSRTRDKLRYLSVLTFNAPKALCEPLAERYQSEIERLSVNHLRLFNKHDVVRFTPPLPNLCHVGTAKQFAKKRNSNDWIIIAIGGVTVPFCVFIGSGELAAASFLVMLGNIAIKA